MSVGRARHGGIPDPQSRIVPSTVAIGKHPIHPMLVIYPIAFLSTVLLTDLLYWLLGDSFWAQVGYWLIVAGLVSGVVAAVVGMIDFFTMPRVRRHVSAWSHFAAGMVLLALAAVNLQLRWEDPVAAVLPWGLLLSAALEVAVLVTGWLGGTLTFGHAIGAFAHEHADAGDAQAAPPEE